MGGWKTGRFLITSVMTATLIFSLLMTTGSVNATLTVITPSSADTFIKNDAVGENHGTDVYPVVRSGDPTHIWRILVKFDLSSIPSGSTVNVAQLSLYKTGAGFGLPRVYTANRLTGDWVEGDNTNGVTWNEANHIAASHPGSCTDWTDGGDFTTDGAASASVPGTGQWMTWDATAIVKAWIEGGQPNYGFLIRDPNDGVASTDDSNVFLSREEGYWQNLRPILEIDWSTPTPTPTPRAVGGYAVPVNKLAILAPYLALIGLVGAVTAAVAIQRRKP